MRPIMHAMAAVRPEHDVDDAVAEGAHAIDIVRRSDRISPSVDDHQRTLDPARHLSEVNAFQVWFGLFYGGRAAYKHKARQGERRDGPIVLHVEHGAPGHDRFDAVVSHSGARGVMTSEAPPNNSDAIAVDLRLCFGEIDRGVYRLDKIRDRTHLIEGLARTGPVKGKRRQSALYAQISDYESRVFPFVVSRPFLGGGRSAPFDIRRYSKIPSSSRDAAE